MKYKFLVFACVVINLLSCKKDSTTTSNPQGSNKIIFTVDGTQKTYTKALGIYGRSSFSGNMVMNLTSLANYPSTIELIISSPDSLHVGTYINDANQSSLNILYDAYVTSYTSGNGVVNITSLTSTNVKGTFSGIVNAFGVTKSITNGSFDVDLN